MERLRTRASPLLTALLAPIAAQINRAYEVQKGPRGTLDSQVFSHWFLTLAEPLAARVTPPRIADIAEAVLELMGRDLLGNEGKYPGQAAALARFCETFILAYSEEPRQLLFAFWNLGQKVSLADLVETCGDQGPFLGFADLLDLGVLGAWTRGQCFYREAALQILSRGEKPGFRALLRAGSLKWSDLVEGLQRKPWHLPGETRPEFFRFTGGFAGFGASFSAPPILVRGGESPLTVSSGTEFWEIYGDAYGLGLLRIEFTQEFKKVHCEIPELVSQKMESLGFPASEVTSSAWWNQVLAWTSQHSYKVYFLTF